MAEDKEKLEVELVDDAGAALPPESDVTKPEQTVNSRSEVVTYDDAAKAELAKWQTEAEGYRAKVEENERQLNDVVRYAQSVVNENKRLAGLVKSGEKVLVDQAGGRVKAELQSAEQTFKKAYEDGDSEAMLKAQKDIARLSVEDAQVRQYQPVQVNDIQPPAQTARREAPTADAKSQAWLDKNKSWWMTDKPMTGYALGIHEDLVRKGVKPGTDEYVQALDKGMADAFPAKFSGASEGQKPEAPRIRTQGGAVAPANRTVGGKTTKVQISPSMASMARRLGVPVQAYAEELARLENG